MRKNPLLLRVLPTLIGLAAFAAMASLYKLNTALYLEIFKAIGVNAWSYPFIDGEFMYAMKHCWLQGVDVYQSVPCDVVPGNKMAYSPLWQRLPMLPDDVAARAPIGLASDLLLLLSVAWLPASRSLRDAILLSLAILSPMVCFALERNNIDVWIYLLIFVAGLLFGRSFWSRCLSYLVFFVAGLLKYYPLILFALALRERATRFWAIAFASLGGLALFGLAFHRELLESLQNVPAGPPVTDLVSIANIPMVAAIGLENTSAHSPVVLALRLGLTALVFGLAYRLAARRGFAASLGKMPEADANWLVIGCLVMGGCYLAIQNVGYRGVYLLPVLAGLLGLRSVAEDPRLRVSLGRATLAIVPIMWMEGIRHWADVLAESLGASWLIPVRIIAWLAREVLWLYLASVMTAVVMSYIANSALGRSVLDRAAAFKAPAPQQS